MDVSNCSHFVMIPILAIGHMNPMLDLAKALAQRGSVVTFVTTPLNAKRMESSIDHCITTRLPIRFAVIPFPSSEAGLPEGCENLDSVSSSELRLKFMQGVSLLKEPLMDMLLNSEPPRPSCFIAGVFIGFGAWVFEISKFFEAPTLIFNGAGMFSTTCDILLKQQRTSYDNAKGDGQSLHLPGILQSIMMTHNQLPSRPALLYENMAKGRLEFDGMVVNSFAELEMEYVEVYKEATGKNIWMVGPLSLFNNHIRGNKSGIDVEFCIKWLDSHKERSVVYACFGSMSRLSKAQLVEVGLGLENSNHPFIWVIRQDEELDKSDDWLSKFEMRMMKERKGQGLVIRGWSPQLLILSHPSTGGFLTHCGWNSIMEGISMGIPMITLPLLGEQFLNEKLVVDVLRIGISISRLKQQQHPNMQTSHVVVENSIVTVAVERLMDRDEEGEIRRRNAKKLSVMAKIAMDEGGSSHTNLAMLNKYCKK